MRNGFLPIAVGLTGLLLAGWPAEGPHAGPEGASAAGGRGPSGYVPPLVEEAGPVRLQLIGLLHTGREQPGWAFSARTIRDLLIVVEYRDLPAGPHTQRLKLFLPDGALYQQFTREFAADGPPERGRGRRGPGREVVETRLPVGGTWITEHGLYGKWRFEVYLDQAPQPTASHTFTLAK